MHYEMIIWWSVEDDAYVVDVPELPGCMAHGATRRAAIKHAEDAIEFWI
jgi:predicted RNase H-like HicB family nuclease